MPRTDVNTGEQACSQVIRRCRPATKREALTFALRMLAVNPASVDDARALPGIGWEGALEARRSNRAP